MTDDIDGPDDQTWPHGPIGNPIDRWAHLPEWKRQWFEDKSRDDLQEITQAAEFIHRMQDWGRITKWIVVTIIAFVIGVVALGDAVLKPISWLRH